MAQVLRPLRHWPRSHRPCCFRPTQLHLILPPFAVKPSSQQFCFATLPFSRRNVDIRPNGLRLPETPVPSDLQESNSDSEYREKKSRNEKKREARRAFRWGMELATFSSPQIKRILRVASLERDVFDALMLVKRLGPDVREGKRRQFNYIGRLLRKVQPELMDALIQAMKDGDHSKLQALSVTEKWIIEEEEEEEETEHEEEEEGCHNHVDVATRWFEGLIDKDSDVTNEVYSVNVVEFDRQELRKLVRRVHSMQEQELIQENDKEVDAALTRAKKSLIHFLHALAKQMPTE